MPELWDAYDKKFNKIENITLVKGELIPDGIYHLVSEVIVKHVDGSYLLMQRDFRKHYGGKWELTACGSALKGENALDCAIRELKEETGICSQDLQEVEKIIHDNHRSLYVVYLCIVDINKNDITLQDSETIDYKWIDETSLLQMDENDIASSRTLNVIKKLSKFLEV